MSIESMAPPGDAVPDVPADTEPVDARVARIVDLGQRRADRAAALVGLVPADPDDVEVEPLDETGTLVDEPALPGEPVLVGTVVDPVEAPTDLRAVLASRAVPILPPWLQTRRAFLIAADRLARDVGYHAGAHLVRSPWYAARIVGYGTLGAGIGAWRLLVWARAEEGNYGLRQLAASRGDAATWLALDSHRRRSSSARWWAAGGAYLAAAGGACLLYSDLLPWWARLPAIVAGAWGLARYGRKARGHTTGIITRTVATPAYRRLTAELTRRGILATGLVKKPEDISFPAEIRTDGPGYLAIVDLPDGVIAADVMARREHLAAGLRLPLDRVWPEAMPTEHPGRLAVWVADRPVSQIKHPEWPYLRRGTVDYFEPFIIGHDQRLRPVFYRFDQRSGLWAGVPGSGKSQAARTVANGGALDPLVRFVDFDLKGNGDFAPFEPLCIRPDLFGCGADQDTKERALAAIEWLRGECTRRAPRIAKLAAQGLADSNHLTRAMCHADPSLYPIVAIFDEIQELLTDATLGKPAKEALTSLVKLARAQGVHVMLMSQRIDKESIPKGISSNIAIRTCLAVPSHVETDLVLGTGAYARGARPTAFRPGADADAGWGVQAGLSPEPRPMYTTYLDNKATAAVITRALALRNGITPEQDTTEARDLITDVLACLPAGAPGIHWQPLAGALAERWPTNYGTWTAETTSAHLRSHGVPSVKVNLPDGNLRGCRRDALLAATEAR